MVKNGGGEIMCCGEPMSELIAKSPATEGTEKHLPVVEIKGEEVLVKVGSVPHPMAEDHYIEWVYLYTDKGGQRRRFNPGEAPEAIFHIEKGEKVVEVYAYCNKHGLWKTVL
jgi:superoxide reductase